MPKRILAGLVALMGFAAGSDEVHGLRCDYLANPLGIDTRAPALSWRLDSAARGDRQTAYHILVASSPEKLRRDTGDLWDSGKVSLPQSAFVAYAGRPLASGTACWWKVRVWTSRGGTGWSEPAKWSMGLLQESDWYARWIGHAPTQKAFPWLRRNFELEQKPRRATAYVNALGYYELYINGKKVDDHVLAPAVSDYSRRTYYITHDVTDYLAPGVNCVALWLGRGWYVRGHPGVIHDGPLVRAQIEAALPDGTIAKLGTDASWKVASSPITPLGRGTAFGDYGGEHYDARLEMEGWNTASFDDSAWQPASMFDPPRTVTSAQNVEPNRIIQTLKAVSVEESPKGAWLIDMGRNYTGWLELRLPPGIPAGTAIRVEFTDATPAPGRYMSANQRDEYVARTGGDQAIRSRFNYHAFRYAHVTGLEPRPALDDIRGYFIRTAYQPASAFECSNELLNRIYRIAAWTYECLTLGGYVVDCPTRERLGYGGDAGTSIETGLFNFDTGGLYNRWAANWRDAQDPTTGDVPYTAPNYPDQGGGGPMWSGFCVTLPWHVYLHYGDRRVLESNYPTIRKWLAFAESRTKDHILEPYVSIGIRMPQWNYLGDWVTPRREGVKDAARDPVASRFINNCHYLYTLDLAARIAAILGHGPDEAKYRAEATALRKALQERFYRGDTHSYATGEQPYLALGLLLDLAPQEERAAIMENLERTILVKNAGHIDAGMHGAYFLLKLLMEEDRNDLIYEMATRTTYPGWGHMLEQGATTFWESWSGGSHIHDTLISIGSWFIQGIGGIRADPQSPGFGHFRIQPALVKGLTWARTHYDSVRGRIASDWRIEDGELHLDVLVPPGTTATVSIPSTAPGAITNSGRPAEKGKAVYTVSSGRHTFVSKLAR